MADHRRKPLPEGYRVPAEDGALLSECRIDVFRAGGPGGQHQNRTESGVRLVHLPTGIVTTERRSRSQHRNRVTALRRLREKLEERAKPARVRKRTRPPKRAKERRLREKKRRSEVKKLRRRPDEA